MRYETIVHGGWPGDQPGFVVSILLPRMDGLLIGLIIRHPQAATIPLVRVLVRGRPLLEWHRTQDHETGNWSSLVDYCAGWFGGPFTDRTEAHLKLSEVNGVGLDVSGWDRDVYLQVQIPEFAQPGRLQVVAALLPRMPA